MEKRGKREVWGGGGGGHLHSDLFLIQSHWWILMKDLIKSQFTICLCIKACNPIQNTGPSTFPILLQTHQPHRALSRKLNKHMYVCVWLCVCVCEGGREKQSEEKNWPGQRMSGWRICSSCSLMSQLVIFIWSLNEAKVNKVQHTWVELLLLRLTAKWTQRNRRECKRHRVHDGKRAEHEKSFQTW